MYEAVRKSRLQVKWDTYQDQSQQLVDTMLGPYFHIASQRSNSNTLTLLRQESGFACSSL